MLYNKPALGVEEQIQLLKDRGLNITDDDMARHYLTAIGYYRLSGYMHFFYESPKNPSSPTFKSDIDFKQIISLYDFDRELRIITLDALEKIEITSRSVISNVMSLKYNPFWYTEPRHFGRKFGSKRTKPYEHYNLLKEIKNAKAPFLDHYRKKYSFPEHPPSWMALEVLSFGALSIMFSHLKRDQIKAISSEFNLSPAILSNWLLICSYLRNICAHHARLWNRKFIYKVKPKGYALPRNLPINEENNYSFFAYAAVLKFLLDQFTLKNSWSERIQNLFDKYQGIPLNAMKFPKDWKQT
ncbi:MAG TPA: Abi family protein, partial [Candidatus Berkiella sp.]|nr:Abi family protein [Candidatus Berkiella sp.]